MKYQSGFTLFELMIAIAVISILSAIAVPAYQGYIQKAALTDALQTLSSYRSTVELCHFDNGSLQNCNSGQHGVPATKVTRYLSAVVVASGVITLTGQGTLQGLSIVLTPAVDNTTGELNWRRACQSSSGQQGLVDTCKNVFRFADE